MQKPIIKITIIIWFLLAIFGVILGMNLKQKEIDRPEKALVFFKKNRDRIIGMNDVLLQHRNIEWVQPSFPLDLIPYNKNMSSEENHVYKKLNDECRVLGVWRIASFRKNGNIVSISYTLYAKGILTGSGRSVSIEYVPNAKKIGERIWQNESVMPTDMEHWYIVWK